MLGELNKVIVPGKYLHGTQQTTSPYTVAAVKPGVFCGIAKILSQDGPTGNFFGCIATLQCCMRMKYPIVAGYPSAPFAAATRTQDVSCHLGAHPPWGRFVA